MDDRYLAELQRRRSARAVVNPEPKAAAMTDADRQWVREVVLQYINAFAEVVGEETAKNEKQLAKALRAEIAALREEFAALKAEIREHKPSAEDSVTSLRGRHVNVA
jgi:seryl-tRNA synthetase